MDSNQSKNKRNRMPLSCTVCRKRKVKCDRGKPHCKVCEKYKVAHLCSYNSPKWANSDGEQVVYVESNNSGDEYDIKKRRKLNRGSYNTVANNLNKSLESNKLFHADEAKNSTPVIHELNHLKDKIKQIEASISVNDYSASTTPLKPHSLSLSPFKNQTPLPPIQSLSTNNSNISLPPIQPTSYSNYSDVRSIASSTYEPSNKTRLPSINAKASTDDLLMYLKIDPRDEIDFYEGYPSLIYKFSRIYSYGPLAWMSQLMKDNFSKSLRDEVLLNKRRNIFKNLTSKDSNFEKRMIDTIGIDDMKPLSNLNATKESSFASKKNPSLSTCSEKLQIKLIEKLRNFIPNTKVLWLLIKRFFKYCYPFAPYLDQSSFIKDVQRITKSDPNIDILIEKEIPILQIDKKLDLALMGSLMIVLRFAYQSLVGNSENEEDFPIKSEEEQYLLSHPIIEEAIELAEAALDQFKTYRRCALPIFQCSLLIAEHQKVDGAGAHDDCTHIYIGMLSQLAVSIGLNRDPSFFDQDVGNSRLGTLWRKIWYGLLSLDTINFIKTGSSRIISMDSFDTKLPTFDPLTSNIEDLELEKAVIENFKKKFEIETRFSRLASHVVSLKIKPTIHYIVSELMKLGDELYEKFGSFRDILLRDHNNNNSKKVSVAFDVLIYLQSLLLVQPLMAHVLVHYENKKNITACKFFSFKTISMIMPLISNFHEVVCDSYKYFGYQFDIFVTPTMELTIHKSWISYISLSIKIILANDKHAHSGIIDKEKLHLFKKIRYQTLYKTIEKSYLPALRLLAGRYFYGWKLLKAHEFIFKLLQNRTNIFEKQKSLFNVVDYFTNDDLSKLYELMDVNNHCAKSEPSDICQKLMKKYRLYICDEDPHDVPMFISQLVDPSSTDTGSISSNLSAVNTISPADNSLQDNFWLETFYSKFANDNDNAALNYSVNSPHFTQLAADTPLHDFTSIHLDDNDLTLAGLLPNMKSADEFIDGTIYEMYN